MTKQEITKIIEEFLKAQDFFSSCVIFNGGKTVQIKNKYNEYFNICIAKLTGENFIIKK